MSSRMRYRAGTTSKISTVAKSTPKPSDSAMGMRKRACTDVSAIIGARPKKVVSDVSRIGRNRRVAPWTMASSALAPARRYPLVASPVSGGVCLRHTAETCSAETDRSSEGVSVRALSECRGYRWAR